ncbi:hypothetical protein N2152v2_008293 [Parachlorella kessleri]
MSSSDRDNFCCQMCNHLCLTVVVAGASGDLAKKKTYPALFFLFSHGFLPKNFHVVGYARTKFSDEDLRAKLRPFLGKDEEKASKFLERCSYVAGSYDQPEGFQALNQALLDREAQHPRSPVGRLYYLALPPSVYPEVTRGLKENCDTLPAIKDSWIRVIVEKPFGKDLASSEELAGQLGSLYPESQLWRIDHYLGKEMTQNLFVMRFANSFMAPNWNRNFVSNIVFKEDFGTQGRGGYFDEFGIIRDVIQNHLMQLLATVAMEKPASIHPDDIRDEKVKVLRCIRPPGPDQVVLGQYTGAGGEQGYTEDPTVPKGSKTPTFASVVLFIDNDRLGAAREFVAVLASSFFPAMIVLQSFYQDTLLEWAGVPFILKAGKALDNRKAEIRVQFEETPHFLFPGQQPDTMRNELVVRLQPDEAIYLKMIVKKPGLDTEPAISELDLDYKRRYQGVVIPDAYPKLILDCIRGDQQHFVRRDELRAAWAIFTPLLHQIDRGEVAVFPYPYGSRGPAEADNLLSRMGFVRTLEYSWGAASLAGVRGALVDLNGTLHVADQEIEGSVAALQKLRDAGIECRFVTNTTKDTRANLLALVQKLGFNIQEKEVFSSLAAARKLVEGEQLKPFLLLHPNALHEFEGLSAGDPDTVVVGLAKGAFSYENMNRAFRILLGNPKARLIAIHKGRVFKEPDGLSLGPGPYVVALEHATGKTAQVVGKPESSFFRLALDDLGCSAGETVMIGTNDAVWGVGDDVRDDVGGAQQAGMRGILVQTGKYRPGDEHQWGVSPDATVANFAAAVDWILASRG